MDEKEKIYHPESLRAELEKYSPDAMIRVVMMPEDTNPLGFIFGGVILSHLDLAAGEEALKAAGRPVVTKVMREIDFSARVQVGDWVSFYTRTVRTGRTSVLVEVLVTATRGYERREVHRVTSAEAIFVAVDDENRPAPLLNAQAPG